jgi:O-glycosyl hydrolase
LHAELEPLKRGALVNLYVSDQQYAYVRQTKDGAVVIVINNDTKPTKIAFAVSTAGLTNDARLVDRLGSSTEVQVENGKIDIALPARSAAIFVPK